MDNEITLMQIMDRFSTEDAAREYFEGILWPGGPTCPHCGNEDASRIYKMAHNAKAKIRNGLYKCAICGQQFTVTVGTVLEDSHIPLNKWLVAFYMMCASKTQISALRLQRQLELGSYRSALFMCYRIRYALKEAEPKGKLGCTVEVDETVVGSKMKVKGRAYKGKKTPLVFMVEHGSEVRSQAVQNVTGKGLAKLLKANVKQTAKLNMDESTLSMKAGEDFTSQDAVNHSEEGLSRKDKKIGRRASTNMVKGYFRNTKRNIDGTHYHVSEKYLPLYVAKMYYKYKTHGDSNNCQTMMGIKKSQCERIIIRIFVGDID